MVALNDDYLNEEEEVCPLCVEEMDSSDKRFKPCPCGYQICQFCYNNIRQNPELNGRCPACRRKYDDESVQYIELTPEEVKAENARKIIRDKERKQREKERKEQENASRKHLAGMRVIQKNLVYVVGLNPPIPPEELHSALRSEKYFGQYGKILKVVVNKRNQNANSIGNNGYGIYVTFVRREDADKCIRAIDGSIMDSRIIRAAYGTTKYCSSYLRGLPCPNPNCMFLHEPGEEADSYTRQDMSTHQGNELGRHREGGIIRYGLHNNVIHPSTKPGDIVHDLKHVSSSSHGINITGNGTSNSTSNGTSNGNGISNGNSSTSEHRNDHSDQENAPDLPATASWAKNVASGTTQNNSPKPRNATLANASAFPTLAETALQRNNSGTNLTHLVHKERKKDKHKDSNAHGKKEFKENIDELVINELSASEFMSQTLNLLTSSFGKVNYEFKTDLFEEKYGQSLDDFPPMFAFASSKNLVIPEKSQEIDYFKTGTELINAIIDNRKAANAIYNTEILPPKNIRTEPQPPLQHLINALQNPSAASTPRAGVTPPPGLLNKQLNLGEQQYPQQHSNNHSTEILNHLLNGKKIAT